MITLLAFILVSELLITAGQICLKKSANLLDLSVLGPAAWLRDLIKVLFSGPMMITGAAGMLAGLLFWILALKAGDLSVVYSLRSMQFVFVLLAGHFFLGERISLMKVIGTALITGGIILIVVS